MSRNKYELCDYTVPPSSKFWLPSDEDRKNLQQWDIVQLVFTAPDCITERMWVDITEKIVINGEPHYQGVLNDIPVNIPIMDEEIISFTWKNIIDIVNRDENPYFIKGSMVFKGKVANE